MNTTGLKGSRLSQQQTRLWSFQKEGQIYRTQCAVLLQGNLDVARLQYGLKQLVARHELLRTVFKPLPGTDIPLQIVLDQSEPSFLVIDLADLSAEEQTAWMAAYWTAEQERVVNLEHTPVLHTSLLRLQPLKYMLFINLPTLCADALTLKLLIAELGQLYAAPHDNAFPDEPLQYADVSAWQDELLQEEDAANYREFWQKMDLSTLSHWSLPLRKSEQMEAVESFQSQLLTYKLPAPLSQQLATLAQLSHTSLEAVLLTCWQVLLWRLSDASSLVLGVVCNGRPYEELLDAPGLYSRVLPLPVKLTVEQSWKQAFVETTDFLREAVKWQAYFTWETGNSQHNFPTYPAAFEYEFWPASFAIGAVTASLYKRSCSIEPCAIKLNTVQVGEDISLEIRYNPAQIADAHASHYMDYLLTLLEHAAQRPSESVGKLPLLNNAQVARLLTQSRGPASEYPQQLLHRLFEEQAMRTPQQIAVTDGRDQITYAELNKRANRLAHYLRQQGVSRNVLVGLCVERSLAMIVGLLGILKAGGAYVPLDPELPTMRLAYQLSDTQAPLLITQEKLLSYLPSYSGHMVCLDHGATLCNNLPDTNVEEQSRLDDLAYVIYTSGSTGVPKGVQIRQRSIVNYTHAVSSLLASESGLHFATVSTLAADLGNTMIFCSLLSGGCLHVLDYETVTDGEKFARYVSRHPIDVLKIVPSHLRALLATSHGSAVLPRKHLVLGGEAFPAALLREIRQRGGVCDVTNHYGPTETTIGVLVNPLGQDDGRKYEQEKEAVIPLGRPLANCEAYVLDKFQHLVPPGVTGELYIGGVGLAAGYLHLQEQTEERFIAHPFNAQTGAKLYRTGDLARYTENGQIEFLGRIDNQVKLRGYRIELDEIEAMLGRHEDIRECVVILREDAPGEQQLVGYVVARDQSLEEAALRSYLQAYLPEYMLPSAFVILQTLPLTTNGKVDRKNLPRPERHVAKDETPFVGPRNPIEEMIVDIWQQLLKRSRISIHDNFFRSGGHSLLATQIISRIRNAFGVELPILSLFEGPTIAQLAEKIQQSLRAEQGVDSQPIASASRDGALPLSFAQQRLWFLEQLEPGTAAYTKLVALRLQGKLEAEALERSLRALVERHEILRTTFRQGEGYPVQVIGTAEFFRLQREDLSDLAREASEQWEAELRRFMQQEAQRSFDLAEGPLFRAILLRRSSNEHVMLLTMHHIISDGWSNAVFMRELAALYSAFVEGRPATLAPLPLQYADFASWQQQWLRSGKLEGQLDYWQRQLAGVTPLELPTDRPRPAVQTANGAEETHLLPAELMDRLKKLSQREDVTLFMTLLAAFQVLLARYSGQKDIVVGTLIANRNRAEIEGLIGLFINALAIRVDLSDNPSFMALLKRVRETTLNAYIHQDIPFEQLVEVLQPQRDLSRSPIYQVMMLLQNTPQPVEEFGGVKVSLLENENQTAILDMMLTLTETKQGLSGIMRYNTDLFEAATIQRMLRHWQTLLEAIVQHPSLRVSDLPMLTPDEYAQILKAWNDTALAYPLHQTVVERFEEQVMRTPQEIAAVYKGTALTYQEVNQRANQLARLLRSLHVGSDALVGIYMERSIEMLVSILGIFKAGAGYVPLDPAYPQERLTYMLTDANIEVLITQPALTPALAAGMRHVIPLDPTWQALNAFANEPFDCERHMDQLAYVIYTSGSTGRPKGVMVHQRGILNHLYAKIDDLRIMPTDVVAQTASHCFDISVWQFLAALLQGGQIHIIPDECVYDPALLLEHIATARITILEVVPSLLRALIDEIETRRSMEAVASLRWLVVTGEALPVELCNRWSSLLPDIPIVNAYGPTECSDDVTHYIAALPSIMQTASVPIGRALANTRLYILDEALAPVPIGVPGELFVGGTGVGRGYLNDPRRTAEVFIPDIFSKQPGERLYKTGDLVRYHHDGNIEYLGRIDHQVKVRGFRIELGEIEAVLLQHQHVQACVVVVREEEAGDKHLVAYIVPRDHATVLSGELRTLLLNTLPEYMIPTYWVTLEALPLTPNGKIDRQALPAPQRMQVIGQERLAGPRTPIEAVLTEIWRDRLHLNVIGIHDNFFEIGGHSLLATQVISRIRTVLQVEIPLRSLFEAPTIAELAEHIEGLLRHDQGIAMPPLVAIRRDGNLPLSFAQQRLWFLEQLDPGNFTYNIPLAVRLEGHLYVQALERSLREIVRRHEILRTTYRTVGDNPVQVIGTADEFAMRQVDLRGISSQRCEAEIAALVRQEARVPFDLEQGPVLRATLLLIAEKAYGLLLTMHHIASDAWSNGIFIRELTTLYAALIEGRETPLPELPLQYADFAAWQRQWLQGEVLESQLRYWKQQLEGADSLNLPTDRPRPPVQTYHGERLRNVLPDGLIEKLQNLSQQEGTTLFMTLLAAFQVLLSRYTGQQDISVGSPIANRNSSDVEGLIGCFVNTLVLRTDLSGDPTFQEAVRRVKEVALGAYAHQDLPFEKLVEVLQPERDMSRPPLFQVSFVMQNAPFGNEALAGLKLSPLEDGNSTAKIDLTLTLMPMEQGLGCMVEYNTDLFDLATIQRFLRHWQTLLESIADDPTRHIAELPILLPTERQQILHDWNDTRTADPGHLCLHQLFEAQAELTPDAIAITYEDVHFTYAAVNRQANQIARYLRAMGVEQEMLVGLCMERCPEMVVGLLGILKAGGAYVPLDPTYPEERLAFMLEELPILLTQEQLREHLPVQPFCLQVCLDSDWEAIAAQSAENLVNVAEVENLAYVIYTSGSTGRPKGVQVTHRGIYNLMQAQMQYFGVGAGNRVLQFSTPSFDASVWEIIMALLTGATLCIGTRASIQPGPDLQRLLQKQQITIVTLPPSALAVMPSDGLTTLETVVTAGEACTADLVERWAPGRRFFNAYGPTEATVCATVVQCWPGQQKPSIGRPLSNIEVYILDAHLQPVPIGVAGELYLGGISLARGYLNQPDLTAERFVPHPFSAQAGARLYKTGDLARYLPDGQVDFLGRVDHQVKVRGFRIELGEIEEALLSHPGVQECVVIASEDALENRRLVAYVVPNTQPAPTTSNLRTYLQDRLPAYMLPSIFIMLEHLPLLPNGKVNRKALPSPDTATNEVVRTFVAPRSPVEESLVEIWQELLGRSNVGIHDNFFEIGGQSLLATQLISRLQAIWQIELPLRSFFEEPTIAQLAARIETMLQQKQQGEVYRIIPVPRDQHLPLSFAQQRLWFLEQLEPGNAVYTISIAARLRGPLHVNALQKSLAEIVQRHESLRTTFKLVEGQVVQIIEDGTAFELVQQDMSELPMEQREAEVRELAEAEAHRPFDLANGPLLRSMLIRLAEEEHVLLLTMHHIVADGWSNTIFLRELSILYRSFVEGRPAPLHALPVQYADFAVWQRQWLQGEVLEEQRSYWKQHLADLEHLNFPTDRPRPAIQTFNGAQKTLALPTELVEDIKSLCQREGITLFMLLLAAFQVLLARYSGQEDIAVGTPIANRNRAEIEGIIGFFVNTLVMRTRLAGNASFQQVLQQVKEIALAAYAHQDLPFENLVELLQLERDLSRSPLFQNMFVLQNAPTLDDTLVGIEFSVLERESRIARFDLTLTVTDTGQGLTTLVEYNTDLFNAPTIERLLGHWQTLLQAIVRDPACRISDLPLLTPAEYEQLQIWNETQAPYPQDACLHHLFERQAVRHPGAPAVVFGPEAVSYEELNKRANQLAHYLLKLGVGPNVPVGLYVERSLEMVLGILGILKAGGAYVPLDPAYPQQRLHLILNDSKVAVVLTQASLSSNLTASQVQVINLDTHWQMISHERAEKPVSNVTASNLAYIIYTSGSTGAPKGVMIAHEGVVNLVEYRVKSLAVQRSDRVMQFVPFNFDPSVADIFMTFHAGATLYLAPQEVMEGGTVLHDFIRENGITICGIPPLVLSHLPEEGLNTLQAIMVGGDKWPLSLLDQWKPGRRFFNEYGPTETSISATVKEYTGHEKILTIGNPIANKQIYILDAHLQRVPIGVTGEIYIGGVGLAQGYLNRPDLTAEHFVPHPFSKQPGERLYRTGDLARYLPDGDIEFLGRIDHQVKVRGFRIELGEIEFALSQHPAIKECIALVREEGPGNKRLTAYIVPNGQPPAISELYDYLKEHLPLYMIPAVWMILESLPLTPHGKIDVQALPVPGEDSLRPGETFVAPRTEIERVLANIWQQVLGIAQVGIHDNFFTLGGDSILSIQVVSRARQAGLHVTTKLLFQYQTIAQLAAVVDTAPSVQVECELVTGPLPLTPIQHWFFEQQLAEAHHWNQAVLLEMPADLDYALFEQAIAAVIAHHDGLHTRFQLTEQGWQACYSDQERGVPMIQVDLSIMQERQKELIEVLATMAHTSLHLTNGPLVSIVLFETGQHRPKRLFMAIHHLVVDGVSWRILLEDIQVAYQQLKQAGAIQLMPKTTSFQQWSRKLAEYAQSASLRREQDYWLRLAHQQVVPLPRDYTTGTNTVEAAKTLYVQLSADETRMLLQEVPEAYHTQINDVLLTALALSMRSWTQSNTLLVTLEGHGREELFSDMELSRTVGWFTTFFPLLLDLTPDRIDSALKAVKEQLRRMPNHGIGYGLLYYLTDDPQLQASLRALPTAEVSFNYLGQFDQMVAASNLFKPAREHSGQPHSLRGMRKHLLEVNGSIKENQLQVAWTYNETIHRAETMQRLAENFITALRAIIDHCRSTSAGGFTPTDFPLAPISQLQLDQLVENVLAHHQPSPGKRAHTFIQDIYALTPLQQGMLFHSLYTPDSDVYVEETHCFIHHLSNLTGFLHSWQKAVERHEALRTCFYWEGLDTPVQVVCQEVTVPIEQQDWRAISLEEQQKHLSHLRSMHYTRRIPLEKAPLFRLLLIRLDDETYHLTWSFHHIITDGWSIALIFKDLLTFYESEQQGQTIYLEPCQPYRDYIAWFHQQDQAKAEQYWRQALRGFSHPTSIITDTGREVVSEVYAKELLSLSEDTTALLQQAASRYQLTMNTFVQGAWALLLSHYSGEANVIFGSVVSGRPAELLGIESMVGLFINTLPMALHIPTSTPVVQWLQQIQTQSSEMREYEYSSLVEIQRWSEFPHGQALFDSIVVFENYPLESTLKQRERTGLYVSRTENIDRTNYALTVSVAPGSRLLIKIGYDRQRFTPATIKRILEHLQLALVSLASAPEQHISTISLLAPQERLFLEEWNATNVDYHIDRCLHQYFERQAELNPDAIAVVYEEEQLTYSVLNQRANQLAHLLRTHGVGPEVPVGLCLETSTSLVVALLAILKAGGYYLPLDVEQPQERHILLLTDAGVALVLTQESHMEHIKQSNIRYLCLEHQWQQISQAPTENLENNTRPENAAYVLYTSGSTGKPKGVIVEHRNILNYVQAVNERADLSSPGVFAMLQPLSVDSSLTMFFSALLTGGTLLLINKERSLNPQALATLFARYPADYLKIAPSHLAALIWEEDPQHLLPQRRLIIGGEAAQWEWTRQLCHKMRKGVLFNHYGPTETTVGSLMYRVEQDGPEPFNKLTPIGQPLANTQAYVLDTHMRLVPIGVVGELYLSGSGLARGYLGQPAITARCFVPNPFSTEYGSRLYRTGDLVRMQADGTLEFVGRTDDQIKIRGYRIEPGEIEAALHAHEAVRDTVVLPKETPTGSKQLVAYLVAQNGTTVADSEMQQFLRSRLPEQMIPSVFLWMDALPLTPHGKIDRRALPQPDWARQNSQSTFVAPQTPFQKQLAEIWKDILHLSQVSIYDNFFALGGHSLLAVRLVSHIQQQFGREFSIATLFQYPTIADIAAILQQQINLESWSAVVAIQPGGTSTPFFCVHPSGGTVFRYTNLARHLGPDQPFYGLQTPGGAENSDAFRTMEDIAAYYIKEMQTIQPQGPYYLGGWSLGGVIAFEIARQLCSQGQEVALLALFDSYAPTIIPQSHLHSAVENEDMHDSVLAADFVQRFGLLPVDSDRTARTEQEQLLYALKQAKQAHIVPEETTLELFRRLLRLHYINLQALNTYIPQISPVHITLFRVKETSAEITPLADEEQRRRSLTRGWDDLTTKGVEVHIVPGEHGTMFDEPYVQEIAAAQSKCLERLHKYYDHMD
jgi:amino acid adenylation domain-containing protein/non-ribosomal peptide synthase protein (TIGR01720 family)